MAQSTIVLGRRLMGFDQDHTQRRQANYESTLKS